MGGSVALRLASALALLLLMTPSAAVGVEDTTEAACRLPLDVDVDGGGKSWRLATGVRASLISATHASSGADLSKVPIGIVRIKPGADRLAPLLSPMPRTMSPDRHFTNSRVVALTNADFFASLTPSRAVPAGTVVRSGQVLFWSGTRSPSLAVDESGVPRTVRIDVHARLQSGDDSMAVSSVNDPRTSEHVVSAFTDAWRAAVPLGTRTGVVLRDDRVVRVVTNGKPVKFAKGEAVVLVPKGRETPQVGSPAILSVVPTAKDGKAVVHATGHAGRVMRAGRINAPCSAYELIHRPRTTFAWNDEGVTWIIVAGTDVPDDAAGLRSGGATKWQMADLARRLGATWAVSMDGGGSSSLLIKTPRTLRRLDNSPDAWLRPLPVAWAVLASR